MAKPKPEIILQLDSKLGSLLGYRTRAMFGGFGVYLGEQIFAVTSQSKAYFHVDHETQPAFEAEGMGPFEYAPGQFLKSYFELPPRVLKDEVLLAEWAIRAATRPETESMKSKRRSGQRKDKRDHKQQC